MKKTTKQLLFERMRILNPDFIFENTQFNENFLKWFGNSKVVDSKNKPLIVYHGSPDGRELEKSGIFKTTDEKYKEHLVKSAQENVLKNRAYFFTDKYDKANSYADDNRAFDYQNAESKVFFVYLSINNPLIINANNNNWDKYETNVDGTNIKGTRELVSFAQNKNYDGIIINNVKDYYNNNNNSKSGRVFVVFSPTQIKSINNNGAYSNLSVNMNEINLNK